MFSINSCKLCLDLGNGDDSDEGRSEFTFKDTDSSGSFPCNCK